MLQNGNFMDGWETLDPVQGYLRNQRPNHWQLNWLTPGEQLYEDSNSQAKGVPECVHKLSNQLPIVEQLGGSKALILNGSTTYKIFSATAPFGASLSQTVSGLKPYSQATLTVPIQVHLHGETDAYGAESSVRVNGEGEWVNGFTMGDREWYRHVVKFTVPENGVAEIEIRVKSKWQRAKDFFLDDITLDAEVSQSYEMPEYDDYTESGGEEMVAQIIYVQLPPGISLRHGASSQADVVEINVPAETKVEIL